MTGEIGEGEKKAKVKIERAVTSGEEKEEKKKKRLQQHEERMLGRGRGGQCFPRKSLGTV